MYRFYVFNGSYGPINSSLQKKFRFEKLSRTIQECNDISIFKQILTELLNLNKQQTAVIRLLSMISASIEDNKLCRSQLSTDL